MLGAEVADLVALGVDMDLTGFGASEVEKLLAGQGGPSFPDEAPAPPENPVTAVSLARSYLLRRLFESLAWRHHRARA
jgi:hypothetical protein